MPTACPVRRGGFVLAALALAAVGSAACSYTPRQTPVVTGLMIENREEADVQIQVGDGLGGFSGFLIPARSWVRLPGQSWTTVYRITDDCTLLSAGGFEYGDYGSSYAIVILEHEHLNQYHPDYSPPTPGPLSSPVPSNLCPSGPHDPAHPSGYAP